MTVKTGEPLMYGGCPKHPSESMLNCSLCALEKKTTWADEDSDRPICVYKNCMNSAQQMGGMCEHHEREVAGVNDINTAPPVPRCSHPQCMKIVERAGDFCSDDCRDDAGGIEVIEAERPDDSKQYEMVDHPKHYNDHPAGIECIDVIEHMTFNVGSAVKYLWRAGLKPGEAPSRDFDKAMWYINREKQRVGNMSASGAPAHEEKV